MPNLDLPVVSAVPSVPRPDRDAELPSIEDWPDRPILMQAALSSQPASIHRINTSVPIHFESDLFEGHAVLWAADLPSTPDHMFQGQKRKTSLVVQVSRFRWQSLSS